MSEDTEADLLRLAESRLRSVSGDPISLVDSVSLPSPHVLLRCGVDGVRGTPGSVILKQVTTAEFTHRDENEISHRFLNEWAVLSYLEELSLNGPWPRLLASDRHASLLVFEDLGTHPTVEEVLLSPDEGPAEEALVALGESLGRFHSAAYGRTSRFASIRSELGGSAPRSDSTYDLRHARGALEESLKSLQITPSPAFWRELADLEAAVHGNGPFVTLIHADAGPQNFMWAGQESMLVDFEFATVGNAMLDLVSARLGFPHSSDAHTVPLQLVDRLEGAYRLTLSRVIPQMEDDLIFQRGIVDACSHWALVRWAGLWRRLFSSDPGPDESARVELMRSQAFTVYRRFVETSLGTGHREPIAATVDAITEVIERRLPSIAETPAYPALVGR